MKNKIVYGLIFGGAFVLVTMAIIYLNSSYNNIFQFDFSPPQKHTPVKTAIKKDAPKNADTLKVKEEPIIQDTVETKLEEPVLTAAADTPAKVEKKDTVAAKPKTVISKSDSLKILKAKVESLERENLLLHAEMKKNNATPQAKEEQAKLNAANQKKLSEWAKQTAKLYEIMDPKKAAKIIQSYSDNESREILYKMNKKQAAKILSELDTETAIRLTKAL